MTWQLDIHTIDVEQGESALVVACDIAANGALRQLRTMLIDGGERSYAERIHAYITKPDIVVPGQSIASLDCILVSHYDDDHSGGITSLLIADNAYRIADRIAQAAHAAASGAVARNQRIAYGAFAAMAVMLGAYDLPGREYGGPALAAEERLGANIPAADESAAKLGYTDAKIFMASQRDVNPSLPFSTTSRHTIAKAAGIAAANALRNGRTVEETRSAVFASFATGLPEEARLETDGIYANTRIIDIGDTPHRPPDYALAVIGQLTHSRNYRIQAPGIARPHVETPDLGSEVLWGPAPPPAGAPTVHVVARRKMVWRAPQGSVPIASGQPDNDDSFGLIIRFNDFAFYTGGDLPTQGEDLVGAAVMANGLPNPAGDVFPPPARLAAFKCGHHGAETATSNNFLIRTRPSAAVISCGEHGGFQHPAQATIDRLHNSATIQQFFLTNCRFATNHIPASFGRDQLKKEGMEAEGMEVEGMEVEDLEAEINKSFLFGDNNDINIADPQPGHMRLSISEAGSRAAVGSGYRQFTVNGFNGDEGANRRLVDRTIIDY